jgi:hypothetical protein
MDDFGRLDACKVTAGDETRFFRSPATLISAFNRQIFNADQQSAPGSSPIIPQRQTFAES